MMDSDRVIITPDVKDLMDHVIAIRGLIISASQDKESMHLLQPYLSELAIRMRVVRSTLEACSKERISITKCSISSAQLNPEQKLNRARSSGVLKILVKSMDWMLSAIRWLLMSISKLTRLIR